MGQVWRLSKDATPLCVRSVRIFGSKDMELAVTRISVLNDLSQVAVGVEDGSVILLRGDFNSTRGAMRRELLQRPSLSFNRDLAARRIHAVRDARRGDFTALDDLRRVVGASRPPRGPPPGDRAAHADLAGSGAAAGLTDPTELGDGAVTALAFHTKPHSGVKGGQIVSLFVGTTAGLVCYKTAAPRGVPATPTDLDGVGCEPGCGVLASMDDEWYMALAQPSGIFFFSPEDRGVCYSSDLHTTRIAWFRGYLLSVSNDTVSGRCTVSVYDLKNKFVAFTLVPHTPAGTGADLTGLEHVGRTTRSGIVTDILSEWGAIFVLTSNHTLYQLVEKDTSTKLEHLFKIHLFDIAISLAYSNNYDDANIMDIYRMYGDYLHKKNDFDGAIIQYTYTIGYVCPHGGGGRRKHWCLC